MKQSKVFETDWLNSSSVFYNVKTKKISNNINEVIDRKNIEFDNEGLYNYLEFGYSVFGKTPIKDVHFLDHSSSIFLKDAELSIVRKDDISLQLLDSNNLDETAVIDLIINKVQSWEATQKGRIIVPTSGGFDSRFLNLALLDKSRINAFTYGLSDAQSESYEVVYAKELSKVLKFNWRQIELGSYHTLISAWDNIFGPSVHAHGMYQMEFYSKIREIIGTGSAPLLSGIIGDAWAEKNKISKIHNFTELYKIGYTHGLHADPTASLLPYQPFLKELYFNEKKEYLNDDRLRTVEAMRLKMMLLQYLLKVPALYKFKPWSPFLDAPTALSILRIPPERRIDRAWQRDFFKRNNVLFEEQSLHKSMFNTLNSYALARHPLPALSKKLLHEIINPSYIDWINSELSTVSITTQLTSYLLNKRIFNFVLPKVGIVNKHTQAYSAYLTLKPLQCVLESRV